MMYSPDIPSIDEQRDAVAANSSRSADIGNYYSRIDTEETVKCVVTSVLFCAVVVMIVLVAVFKNPGMWSIYNASFHFLSVFRRDFSRVLNSDWDRRSVKKWSRFSFGLSGSPTCRSSALVQSSALNRLLGFSCSSEFTPDCFLFVLWLFVLFCCCLYTS